MILLKKGKAHSTIKGTIVAVAVECVAADTIIERRAANKAPTYPPATMRRYAWKKVKL